MRARFLFDPMTMSVAGLAFREACQRLPAGADDDLKRLVANRILGSASLGLRDAGEMRDDALQFVAE